MNKKFGFTLAEVMVVLVALGIVAAMTIPMTVQKFSNDAQVTQLRKIAQDFETAVYTQTVIEKKTVFGQTKAFKHLDAFIDDRFKTNADSCPSGNCFASKYMSITGEIDGFSCSGIARKLPSQAAVCVTTESSSSAASRYSLGGFALMKLAAGIPSKPFPGGGGAGGLDPIDTGVGGKVNPGDLVGPGSTAVSFLRIQLDTNGTAGPNKGGRDMFEFFISENGDVLGVEPYEKTCSKWGSLRNIKTGAIEPICLYYKSETISDEPGSATAGECKSSALGKKCFSYLYQNDWVMDY